jgi:hypothetical protein
MVMGNSEFQKPQDKAPDTGDRIAGHFQEELGRRDAGTTGYDAAKANFAAVTKDGYMSIGDDPKGFNEKTAMLCAQSPEGIRASIAKNDTAIAVVKSYMDSVAQKIEQVVERQKVQEEFERANRTA